jgi:gluconokinase
MPASLLRSQFDTLEEPEPDEGILTVDAGGSPETEAAAVIAALNLVSPRRPGG